MKHSIILRHAFQLALVLSSLVSITGGPLSGQVSRGEAVRMTHSGGLRVEGTLLGLSRDTLSLLLPGREDAFNASLGRVTKVEIRRKRSIVGGVFSRTGQAVVAGFLGGALLGLFSLGI